MENNERYVTTSLELNLFFARIMKEHAIFLKAGFTPVDAPFAKRAEFFKQEFEKLLCSAIRISDCVISKQALCSGEFFTKSTARAEQQTMRYTGICINTDLTVMEARLCPGENITVTQELCRQVKQLNCNALRLLDGLIAFKENVLCDVLSCKMFTMNYPLLIEHIIREAQQYRSILCDLDKGVECCCKPAQDPQPFWNQIMMEHALFIRGSLDPCENALIETADGFAKDYARLLASCGEQQSRADNGNAPSIDETVKFRDFKAAGAKGIEECKIRSVILPLLADHVLREANHYLRLLGECS